MRDSKLKRTAQWVDVRKRGLGMWAYALNRLSGIGLVVYLYIHLVVLSTLAKGPSAWDPFIQIVRSPGFLMLDVILLSGLLIHGFNGIRVTLNGFGIGLGSQKPLFVILMIVAALAGVWGAVTIFTK